MADLTQFVNELQEMIEKSGPSTKVVEPLELLKPVEKGKIIKILLVTTHVNQVNGYSKVIYNIIQQLAAKPWIKVVHYGTQKMVNADLGRAYPATIKVYDATAMEKEKSPTGFAIHELPGVIQAEKPDVVFLYNDLSVICSYIESIRKVIESRTFSIWAYADLTSHAVPSSMIDVLNRDVERIFCFTKAWKASLKSQGITRPVDVMRHGFDPKMFHAIPRDLARQTLGLPKDVFLFTSLNKNIPRKRLDLLIIAFVKLMVRFPMKNIFMLIVADKGDRGGFPLFEIFAREIKLSGSTVEMFGNRLLITSKDTCYRDEDINVLYNCGDVGISCAEGEGFGLCTFEQMALGVPQIAPEIAGYTEYCTRDNSILIKPKFRAYLPQAYGPVTGQVEIVDTEDVSKAMERYVFDEDVRKLHGKQGTLLIEEYSWDKCCTVLLKRLRAIQEEED